METITTLNFNSYDGTPIQFVLVKPAGNNLKRLVFYFHPGGFYQGVMNKILLYKWDNIREKLDANETCEK
ncbi:MAG: hypothetical protein IPN46_13910 [Saprospiraceae bacterium]|nr:hypothetical protein [Saprospiraceae bacterium]